MAVLVGKKKKDSMSAIIVTPRKQIWDAQTITACIQQAADPDGYVAYGDAAQIAISVPTMARRVFGSWAAACQAAGLKAASEKDKPTYTLCTVPGCSSAVRSPGCPHCDMHYCRLRRTGSLDLPKGDPFYRTPAGYLMVACPGHPMAQKGGRAFHHRIVYYDAHGAGPFDCHWCGKVVTWDTLHIDHVNAVRDDNRLENLVASCPRCNQARGHDKMRATQRSQGRLLTYDGLTMCVAEWAREIGISSQALNRRLKVGWPLERALTQGRGPTGPKTKPLD